MIRNDYDLTKRKYPAAADLPLFMAACLVIGFVIGSYITEYRDVKKIANIMDVNPFEICRIHEKTAADYRLNESEFTDEDKRNYMLDLIGLYHQKCDGGGCK